MINFERINAWASLLFSLSTYWVCVVTMLVASLLVPVFHVVREFNCEVLGSTIPAGCILSVAKIDLRHGGLQEETMPVCQNKRPLIAILTWHPKSRTTLTFVAPFLPRKKVSSPFTSHFT